MNRNNKKIVRLTESDLVRIVRRVIKEEYDYSLYDLKKYLESKGLDVNIKSKTGYQYIDDRTMEMYNPVYYRVTVNNVDNMTNVKEFLKEKGAYDIKDEGNSVSFGFTDTNKM